MNFSLSEEHVLLRESARRFLEKEADLSALLVPGATVADAGYDKLWPKVASLGWPGLIVPEEYGGLGMTTLDLSLILSECGRFLAPCPFFGTLAGTWAVLAAASPSQRSRWLPEVATGNLTLALGFSGPDGSPERPDNAVTVAVDGERFRLTGTWHFVVDAESAGRLIVAAPWQGARRLFSIDRSDTGLSIERLDWRDITRQVCTVRAATAEAELLDGSEHDVWPWVRDRLWLVLAAESAGGLRAVLEATTAYAKERVAFGRPIGAYQSIKHSLADMLAQAECASTAVLYAGWGLSADDPSGPIAAAMAQAYASEAYRDASARSIQVFGAIGFTWEMKNHLYFKRARANAELLGSPALQRELVIRTLEGRQLAE